MDEYGQGSRTGHAGPPSSQSSERRGEGGGTLGFRFEGS